MLRSTTELFGYHMEATDGEIGKAYDFLFDDETWTVRHLVVDTGKWLPGRRVIISPQALREPDRTKKVFHVNLSCDQIKNSPSIDVDKPVSRQHQIELFEYYSWTPYWGAGMVGPYPEPGIVTEEEVLDQEAEYANNHLRSMHEVKGYHLVSGEEKIGRITDFIVEDGTWIVRYVVSGTHVHMPGRKVLISPSWLEGIRWEDKSVETDLERDQLLNAPSYDPSEPVNREYEERLYDYYGRPKYWKE